MNGLCDTISDSLLHFLVPSYNEIAKIFLAMESVLCVCDATEFSQKSLVNTKKIIIVKYIII